MRCSIGLAASRRDIQGVMARFGTACIGVRAGV